MKSRWQDSEAQNFSTSDLLMRVYTSRLLGQESDLVLHGGGNTSVKSSAHDFFGNLLEVLYVKGSGWDLATIEQSGFAPVRLDTLIALAEKTDLSDAQMVKQQRLAMLDPNAPNPSVEAILHAIIPFKFVDHTHADAILTLTNTTNAENRIRQVYGDNVLIIPYVMPGFALAKKVHEMTRNIDWDALKGLILMNHGAFTFANDAQVAYENMIDLASLAQIYIISKIKDTTVKYAPKQDLDTLIKLRKEISSLRGQAVVAHHDNSDLAVGYSKLPEIQTLAQRGPLTPDHSILAKRIPMIANGDPQSEVALYASEYQRYFEKHADSSLLCLDKAPRWVVWQDHGLVSFGANADNAAAIADIAHHTASVVQNAHRLGDWLPLSQQDIFDVEYWELEQAKLKKKSTPLPFQGKVAIVSGAASGIGRACCLDLLEKGVAVIALDINIVVTEQFSQRSYTGIVCDLTDAQAVKQAVDLAVSIYGGLDIVISNAGIFVSSNTIEQLDEDNWNKSLSLNLDGHKNLIKSCVTFLKQGIDPAIVVIGSKNVPAPGPGAAAYSVAKAALVQFARIAALEMAEHGIRVNIINPDCVYDTGIWDDQTLEERASHYNLTVDEYKRRNLLKTSVSSAQVAALASQLCGDLFACTTGAQIPIDGGNERII